VAAIKTAAVAASSANANAIVAAVSGKSIKVLGYALSGSAAVNAKWQSGSTDLTGLIHFLGTAPDKIVAPIVPQGSGCWFKTAAGEALNLHLSGATAVGGHVVYQEE